MHYLRLLILFGVISFQTTIAQTPTTNNVFLWYYVNTPVTTTVRSPYYSAQIRSPFTNDDYNKILKLSAKRIWLRTNAGDSLYNIDWAFGYGTFYNPQRAVNTTATLSIDQLKYDPTTVAPVGSDYGYEYEFSWDRFRMKDGRAESNTVSVGPDYLFLVGADSILIKNKKGKEELKSVNRYVGPEKAALSFCENLRFDPLTGIFSKNVTGSGIFQLKSNPVTGEQYGYSPMIFLQNPNGNYFPSNLLLLKKNVIIDESLQMQEQQLMHDSFYSDAKPADVIDRLQYGFTNIPSNERIKFLSSLFYFAFHNPTSVFPVNNMIVDSLHPFKSSIAIQNLFCSWDSTNQIESTTNPGVFYFAPIRFDVLLGNIYAIRFYEDWYYDPIDLTIKKHVNGIGFIEIQRDMMDQPRFKDTGIYIKLN